MSMPPPGRAIQRAFSQVHAPLSQIMLTDLTKTHLGDVQNRYFRLFVPVKRSRLRLPTSLPEFGMLRHHATLSDSPLLAARRLGGHWSDHNLAAICHLAACNLRCPYCYVEYRHLSARDGFRSTASELVNAFVEIRAQQRVAGVRLSILRISGGEPMLAPDFIMDVYDEMTRRGLTETCLLKVESNMTAFPYALSACAAGTAERLKAFGARMAVHVTAHPKPGEADWPRLLAGLEQALALGLDVYPAIGGADWSDEHLREMYEVLAGLATDLPLRLAVRPFNLSYDVLHTRRGLARFAAADGIPPSMRWERILREKRGRRYLDNPRHEVSIGS